MLKVFDKDLNTKCYGEFSKLSSNDIENGIRLNSFDTIRNNFKTVKAPFIVLKPLVESQNTPELLNFFNNSYALWMFRNFKDVASSNIKHFSLNNGINNLKPIIESKSDNWRSEKVSNHVRETITKYFSCDMNLYDAAVLFWYARNSLFFDLELDKMSRVLMCKYGDLVTQPERIVKTIYKQLGQPYPSYNITNDLHSTSLQKGKSLELSPEIEDLANEMLDRLETAYQRKIS